MELTAQHLSFYKVQTTSSSNSLTPVYPESPQKKLIRLILGGHHSGTKTAEKELVASLTVLQLLQVYPREAGPGVDLSSHTAEGLDC